MHYILNEIVTGGLVAETAIPNILKAFEEQKKLEKNEVSIFYYVTCNLFLHLLIHI